MISKVIAYIIRKRDFHRSKAATHELLVFAHQGLPDVPIQVPAGTIDPGETPEAALFREIWEESGLTEVQLRRRLGVQELVLQDKPRQQQYFLLEAVAPLPDRWDHQVQGSGLDAGLVFSYFWLTSEQGFDIYSGQTAFLNTVYIPELFLPASPPEGSV